MKTIPIKTNNDKFYRQFLEVLRSVPPISKLRPKELDVLSELLRQHNLLKDYPEEHRNSIVLSMESKKEIREKIGISADSFNNNMSMLRKYKILDSDNRLNKFFNGIDFNGKFELNFIFKE